MGTYVKIKKVKEENGRYIYRIPYPQKNSDKEFYLILNPDEKRKFYFKTDLKSSNLVCIDLEKKSQKIEAFDVPSNILFKVIFMGEEALKTNNFPEYISYHS